MHLLPRSKHPLLSSFPLSSEPSFSPEQTWFLGPVQGPSIWRHVCVHCKFQERGTGTAGSAMVSPAHRRSSMIDLSLKPQHWLVSTGSDVMGKRVSPGTQEEARGRSAARGQRSCGPVLLWLSPQTQWHQLSRGHLLVVPGEWLDMGGHFVVTAWEWGFYGASLGVATCVTSAVISGTGNACGTLRHTLGPWLIWPLAARDAPSVSAFWIPLSWFFTASSRSPLPSAQAWGLGVLRLLRALYTLATHSPRVWDVTPCSSQYASQPRCLCWGLAPHVPACQPFPPRFPGLSPSTCSELPSASISHSLAASSLYYMWLCCLPSVWTRTWGPSLPSFSLSPLASKGASDCRFSLLYIFKCIHLSLSHWHHLSTDPHHFSPKWLSCLLTHLSAPAFFLFSTLGLTVGFHDAPPPGRTLIDWLASHGLEDRGQTLQHGMLVAELTSPASSSTDSELLIPGNAQESPVLLPHVWVPSAPLYILLPCAWTLAVPSPLIPIQ